MFGALYVLTGALGAASQALAELPPAQAALEEAKKGVCHVEEKSEKAYTETDKLLSFLDSLCAIANCQLAEGGKDVLGVKGLKGGYAPYCDKIQDYFSKTYGSDFQNAMKKYNVQPFDIKDSLILSTVCLCLPGIVYNVEKMRQVNCFKAVCLNDYVKEQGYPTSLCNDMTNYFTCALVIGEIFALIPFSAFFEDLIQKSINIITDPVAAFTMALGGVCDSTCDSQGPYAFLGCAALKTFTIIREAVGAYKQYFDTKGGFKPVGQQYCQRMEEIKDELNQ